MCCSQESLQNSTSSPSSERPTPQGRPFSLTPSETCRWKHHLGGATPSNGDPTEKVSNGLDCPPEKCKTAELGSQGLCVGFEVPIS